MEHKLSLFDNAIDSLNESLSLFESANSKGIRRYKFAVLNFCHFTELLFKHFASLIEPEKILYTTKKGETKSITFWEALQILDSNNSGIDKDLKNDLEWIKKVRNDIEHYEFAFTTSEVELFSGKILNAVMKYSDEYTNLELLWYVEDNLKEIILQLCKNYNDKLDVALAIVKEQEDIDYADCLSNGGIETYWRKYICPECDNLTLISNPKSDTGYRCVFCGNTDSDELEYMCDSCSNIWPKSELEYFDYTDEGHFRHMCPVCLHHPDYVKDS